MSEQKFPPRYWLLFSDLSMEKVSMVFNAPAEFTYGYLSNEEHSRIIEKLKFENEQLKKNLKKTVIHLECECDDCERLKDNYWEIK